MVRKHEDGSVRMSVCQSNPSKMQPLATTSRIVWRQIKFNFKWMSDRYKSVHQIHWTRKLKRMWCARTDLTGSCASRTHISSSFGFNGSWTRTFERLIFLVVDKFNGRWILPPTARHRHYSWHKIRIGLRRADNDQLKNAWSAPIQIFEIGLGHP